MTLAIDIGNTRTKIARFDEDDILEVKTCAGSCLALLQQLLDDHPAIRQAVLSSVGKPDTALLELLKRRTKLLVLSTATKLPFTSTYRTPDTLGKDRIAAVAGAATLFPGQHVLVVDAGTCITYDLLTAEKEYLGGAISPGIDMRYRALNTFTEKLPLIKAEWTHQPELTGKSTEASIRSGVQRSVLFEVDAAIDAYRGQFPELKTVVTGGDLNYFDKYLKNNIFAAPNLVLIGLKKILDFNEGS